MSTEIFKYCRYVPAYYREGKNDGESRWTNRTENGVLSVFLCHGESLVLLPKSEIDSKKVRVAFSLEDMNRSGPRRARPMSRLRHMCWNVSV